jgi:hypothetical protein
VAWIATEAPTAVGSGDLLGIMFQNLSHEPSPRPSVNGGTGETDASHHSIPKHLEWPQLLIVNCLTFLSDNAIGF